jgi:hypothetical protein
MQRSIHLLGEKPMSYLNIPRLHFTGQFQADPSTVNNNDANWNRDVQLAEIPPDQSDPTNGAVYWNPNGTHNWQLFGCTVTGVANDQGQFTAPSADPIIGAKVLSNSEYPAKIVDLDPDNQGISQIWGLQIQISIPSPEDPTRVLASMTATMPPTAFCDLWGRVMTQSNSSPSIVSTMSAAFQAVLTDVKWVNATASPLLSKLQEVSPNSLSIRFIVDSFQLDANQAHFTYGRVVGTIGPVLSTDAPRSTPRRLAPILSNFGAVGAVYDTDRSVLILDMGNCVPTSVPTDDSSGTVPAEGWPIISTAFLLTVADPSEPSIVPSILGQFEFTQSTYLTFAGIIEVPVSPALTHMVQTQPLTLTERGGLQFAVQEDQQGRYVDVDIPFLRMNPGDQSTVTLWATQFGRPWKVDNLDVALQPAVVAENGAPGKGPGIGWYNGYPQTALTLSTTSVSTQSNGAGTLTLTAADPGTPRKYPNGELGPDGQVYWITGSWANWGQIFLAASAPINVLVFNTRKIPDNPTWADVGPILSMYTRLCPYMKGIMDLSDYSTVKQNFASIQRVLNLQKEDPHYMPVMRDLSADKLAIINKWILNGMPE